MPAKAEQKRKNEENKVEEMEDEDDVDAGISYTDAAKYWESVSPTIEGMLGGFGKISPIDIDGSSKFLKGLFKIEDGGRGGPGNRRALDCGAGIGRITKHLLTRHFSRVDLVEQNQKFLDQAHSYLGPLAGKKVGSLFCSGLQDFVPEEGAYDLIWCQWVLGHLTEPDLEAFFRRCASGLTPNGVIVVKENVTSSGEIEKDDEDSSVTRPEQHLREIFEKSGLRLMRQREQQKFPNELYPVHMFALRPQDESEEKA